MGGVLQTRPCLYFQIPVQLSNCLAIIIAMNFCQMTCIWDLTQDGYTSQRMLAATFSLSLSISRLNEYLLAGTPVAIFVVQNRYNMSTL